MIFRILLIFRLRSISSHSYWLNSIALALSWFGMLKVVTNSWLSITLELCDIESNIRKSIEGFVPLT